MGALSWVWVVCWFGAGYSLAAGAFGLRGSSSGGRVAWGVALGAAGVFLLVPVVFVWALSGGLPSLANVSPKVWGFIAGVVVASGEAIYKGRGARISRTDGAIEKFN